MATGYDEEGVEELVCVEPSGGADFLPTAMCAVAVQGDEAPLITFGVAHFSMEIWLKWAQGYDSPGNTIWCMAGAMNVKPPPFPNLILDGAALAVYPNTYEVAARYDNTFLSSGVSTALITTPLGWNHHVLNYDRAGNLSLYTNNAVSGAVAIDANAMAAALIWPYVSTEIHDRSSSMGNNDVFPFSASRVWAGPFAMHNRLLTAAEINNSFRNRRVQNISGVTQIILDPRDIEGQTGWETREDYICGMNKGLLHLPFGAPFGTYGDVIIPDSSGNGRDFLLPVAASYQDDFVLGSGLGVASRARCAFIADPWWR